MYFEKLKPGTKNINIIERARSLVELNGSVSFLNSFMVNLNKSQLEMDNTTSIARAITTPLSSNTKNDGVASFTKGEMENLASIINNMYTSTLNTKLNYIWQSQHN